MDKQIKVTPKLKKELQIAVYLCKYAQMHKGYDSADFLQEFKQKAPIANEMQVIAVGMKEDTEYDIVKIWDTIYVSFRGTEISVRDIVPHAIKCSTDYYGFQVHKGYLNKLNLVKRSIKDNLNHGSKIVVTGHSLGGALAQLLQVDLITNGYNSKCVTFGSCKPFKSKGIFLSPSILNSHYYLAKDYVGLFPYGYYVSSEPKVLDSINKYKQNFYWGQGLIKSLESMFVTKRHSVDNYINFINNIQI